jgi:hypothetical protein
MLAFIRKIALRLRTYGLRYFVILTHNEMSHPRFAVTRHLRLAVLSVDDRLRAHRAAGPEAGDDCLQFVYDLSVAPITFDFASYLAAAEIERRLRGFAGIDVYFVPGRHDSIREEHPDYEAVIDSKARLWRVRHMLMPLLAFLPSTRGMIVCGTRQQAAQLLSSDPRRIYPSDYRAFLPRAPDKRVIFEHARAGVPIWPMFRATDQGRRLVADYLLREAKGRRPIVITLRNYGYSPERNSRNEDWVAFADSLDRRRYAAIFVPDSETVMKPPPADFSGHLVYEAASVNLEIRMALYEAAWLNLALMHGPLELCWYNERARYLFFITLGTAAMTTPEAMMRNGHRIGVDLDFAKSYQRIVWLADEVTALRREFAAMERYLQELDAPS